MGESPPESGGDPSRSEGGAVCSKFARSAFHMNFREAHLVLITGLREYPQGARCARALNRYLGFALSGLRSAPPGPRYARASPPRSLSK